MVEFNEKQQKIIDHLVKENGNQYNMLKAAEECQELGLVLTQMVLKPTKVDVQEIIDEIGDVAIRLEILKKIYSEQDIQKRINLKLSKFKEYIVHKMYSQI